MDRIASSAITTMPLIRGSICTAFLTSPTEPYIFLVDEAHNLPDRARDDVFG